MRSRVGIRSSVGNAVVCCFNGTANCHDLGAQSQVSAIGPFSITSLPFHPERRKLEAEAGRGSWKRKLEAEAGSRSWKRKLEPEAAEVEIMQVYEQSGRRGSRSWKRKLEADDGSGRLMWKL